MFLKILSLEERMHEKTAQSQSYLIIIIQRMSNYDLRRVCKKRKLKNQQQKLVCLLDLTSTFVGLFNANGILWFHVTIHNLTITICKNDSSFK